jgi:hypothetical protein
MGDDEAGQSIEQAQPSEEEWERVPDDGKSEVRKQEQGAYTAETPKRRTAAQGESDDPDQPAAPPKD